MADDGKSTQDAACLAVNLGWRLAQLYDSKSLPGPPENAESNGCRRIFLV